MSREKLQQIYESFCAAEGNQHIASEYAILKIQALIKHFKIKSVLELGLGIGSIAGTLLSVNKYLKYSGTEENIFCLKALKSNLDDNFNRLKVFSKLTEVPKRKFDLIIVDGNDDNLDKLKQLINRCGIIVIEGDRLPQQELLLQHFPGHRYVHSISIKKNGNYSPFPPDHWQGGLKILFVNPDIFQKLWWFKEKVLTKFKYSIRR